MLKMQSALLLLLIPALCPAAQDVQPKQKSDQNLPPPFASKSVKKFPKVVGWDKDRKPNAAKGFTVTAYLRGIENPRWIYVLENGDVLVALSKTVPEPKAPKDPEKEEGMKKSKTVGKSPDRIMLLRDAEGDGKPEVIETFLKGLNRPFGMALHNDKLFVANTDGVMIFPYTLGQKSIEVPGKKIIDLPAGGYNQHWTRNLLINPKTQKLFISVGSASNVGEHGMNEEKHRANILESNLDGSDLRVFASGLRNPVGMDWEPTTGVLWTAVNERDELGDDLVPDYLTSVQDGGFYGWPYSYFGQNVDPRRKGERDDLVQKAIVPEMSLDSHTASLGLAFQRGNAFPEKYRGGAFIGQRGSWNRSQFAGYKVVFVPFKSGKPAGPVEDFLSGFIKNDDEVYGRPVGVAFAKDGSLLVADEPGNVIWRVAPISSER